ncbi:MAG: GNAT family N-acetyltransferase [Nocardioides sp.]|uniref:GNAT family N-acetyltransferase n=1 Tax=Nocardioides sp. TaxID=35761 RepID=UPI0039E6AF2B
MRSIREAGPADVALLREIEEAADRRLVELFAATDWAPATPGERRAALPGFLLVVTEGDAVPVGFAHVLEIEGQCHLEQLAVLPEHGRRGHGRALVDAVRAEAGVRGHRSVSLMTYAEVPWNAPFYATCGFVVAPPRTTFEHELARAERRLGLERYGARVLMVADVTSPEVTRR